MDFITIGSIACGLGSLGFGLAGEVKKRRADRDYIDQQIDMKWNEQFNNTSTDFEENDNK